MPEGAAVIRSAPPEEKFFTDGEYARRLRLVRERMAPAGIGALLVFDPPNICYLTGHFSVNLWDYECLVVPLESEPFLVLWEFETARFLASCSVGHLYTYRLQDDPVEITVQVMKAEGVWKRGMGFCTRSRYLSIETFRRLQRQARSLKDGGGLVESVRLIKSDEETDALRRSAHTGMIAMEAARRAVREGIPDREVAAAATEALIAAGSEPLCIEPIVVSGRRVGIPHSTYNGQQIRLGEPVLIELGASFARYTAPMMRTVVAGQRSGELQKLADASLRALDALVAALAPGVRACDAARKGREAIAAVESEIVFHYVFGLPVGLGFPPSWAEESDFLLRDGNPGLVQPGMVFHLPLSMRIPNTCGIGFSETVLVTASGCEVLTNAGRELTLEDKT
jgi:Xaa-Pro dipeptidase